MANLYRIANWESLFETYETKKLAHLKWVPVPNKHDGLGFRRVAAQENRCELFAAWNLILQLASKGKKSVDRGSLERDGRPLEPQDMELMTGFPAKIFEAALKFFSSDKMGWLESVTTDNKTPTDKPAEPPVLTAPHPAEGNGMEGNRIEGKEVHGPVENQNPHNLTPLGIRVCSWFSRRPSTKWSDRELKELRRVEALKTPEEDVALLEARYLSKAPYIRQDIGTLLNNWNGEIDRAKSKLNGNGGHPEDIRDLQDEFKAAGTEADRDRIRKKIEQVRGYQ